MMKTMLVVTMVFIIALVLVTRVMLISLTVISQE